MTRSDRSTDPPTDVLSTAGAVDTETPPRGERSGFDAPTPRGGRPTPDHGYDATRADEIIPAPRVADRDERMPASSGPVEAPARRRQRRNWLVRLAGADQEILARAPADRPKFVSMGAVLIVTAAVAGASAAFAMNTAVKLTPLPAVLVGLLWALVILSLDRMLVVTMVTTDGLRRTLATAIPRVLLAAVIGAIISMPLVLRIFEYEINAELEKMRTESLSAAQTALNQDVRFEAIPGLEAEAARLIGVASGQSAGDLAADPEVKRLREAVAAKEREYTEAENALICESGGNADCGSGTPGRGPIYRDLVDKEQRLKAERDQLRTELRAAEDAARTRLNTASQQETEVAKADLARVQQQLQTLRDDKRQAEEDIKTAERENEGLLVRLEALERLSSGSWMMLAAHGALFLLFLFIEVLPVLMKVLAAAGPATLYDQLLARRDKDALEQADDESAHLRADHDERRRAREAEEARRAQIAEERATVALALEQHRAEAQIEAGKRANVDLAATQEELAQRAIAVWSEVAAARTDEELQGWYERQMDETRRQGDGQRRADGATRSRSHGQAMTYEAFMARKGAKGRTRTPPPAERGRPDRMGTDRMSADGIYRPPSSGQGDDFRDERPADVPEANTPALPLPETDRGGERDGWNADGYAGPVAPPPVAPPPVAPPPVAPPPAAPPRADRW